MDGDGVLLRRFFARSLGVRRVEDMMRWDGMLI